MRKKAASDSESKVRKQKIFNRIVLVSTLIIIILVTVYWLLTRPPGVAVPAYLDRCVSLSGKTAYDSNFGIMVIVRGNNVTIPSGIGLFGTCVRPIHTFSASGTVHIDTDQNRTYTLKDFFIVWAITYGDKYATFNRDQLFDVHGPTKLMIGNQTDDRFENYPLPRNGTATTNPMIIVSSG